MNFLRWMKDILGEIPGQNFLPKWDERHFGAETTTHLESCLKSMNMKKTCKLGFICLVTEI
jgi:hypothetical protein